MFHTVITPNLYFVLVLFPLFSPKDKKFFITIPTIYTHWPIINNQLIKNNTLVPIQQYDVSNLLDKHSKHVLLRYYLLSYSQTSQTPPTLHHRSVSSHCRSSFFFSPSSSSIPFYFLSQLQSRLRTYQTYSLTKFNLHMLFFTSEKITRITIFRIAP